MTDYASLSQLKSIALKGGDRGAYYDLGILLVVNSVEETGDYRVSTEMRVLAGFEMGVEANALALSEITAANTLADALGLPRKHASEFARGVLSAVEHLNE